MSPPSSFPRRLSTPFTVALIVALGLSLTACAGSSTPSAQRGSSTSTPSTTPTTAAPTTTTTTVPPTTTTTTEQPGWNLVSTGLAGPSVDQQTYSASDGAQVTVFRFRAGRVHYDLHDGSEDPPAGSASLGPNAGPSIGSEEAPLLLAAFNGGFKSDTGAGGTEIAGQVLTPLQNGLASFVIDADTGSVHIGIWGANVPYAGEQVSSVRQNLTPLVLNAQPAPNAGDPGAWGATLGGGAAVARSALGQDAQGDLLYAGSMSALPLDMANALVNAGAQVGMELDINPEWVQCAYAPSTGAPLQAGIPGQNRPASQFADGWTRDFVTVLASQ